MPSYKTMVLLTASRKYRGQCLAGKELEGGEARKWVRPVSDSETGELTPDHIRLKTGEIPKIFDVLQIPVQGQAIRAHDAYQTENYLIANNQSWEKIGIFNPQDLPKICDKVDQLWVNGQSAQYGVNDQIPEDDARQNIKHSLVLIKPENFLIVRQQEHKGKIKNRAKFTYNGTEYKLMVTDSEMERKLEDQDLGTYNYPNKMVYLCVSLSEPYHGFCYKLVAGVIAIPK